MLKLSLLGFAIVIGCDALFAQPSAMPSVAPPEGASVERLGDQMIVNGRPMTMQSVNVQRPAAEVLQHYRKALAESANGKIVEHKLAGDQILAGKIGEHFVTVRVRAASAGASDAWVMSTPMKPPSAAPALPSHVVLPAGSQVLSNVETHDGGRRAHTIIATTEPSIAATHDFLVRSFRERGFTVVASDAARQDASRKVTLFQRGTEDVMVTISEGSAGRTVVLNASGPK